jgi:hypothetical protein
VEKEWNFVIFQLMPPFLHLLPPFSVEIAGK